MYTIGDPLSAGTKYPWRLDDEKLVYPFYEKVLKAGINTICIHKGLMPAALSAPFDLYYTGLIGNLVMFLVGYGSFRFLTEFVRQPDPQLGYLAFDWLTMGQVLSTPMIAAGAALMILAYRRNAQ
ncbi:prolipoprotein diacylglyceryl transferase family protein, partial [uncultured Marinobacter sp.]|uniref:prolipoprotein diacylglyceryl transferase family protein n=1 Tax=uncultured Marinobacter sp. TaxID=187379 RepID=UPI00258ECD45